MATDDATKVQRALDNGILMGSRLMDLCREIDFPYYIACAYLEQESTDPDTGKHGANLWGSDNTWMRGVDLEPIFGDRLVDRDTYLLYKVYRDRFGAQGVGPMQLTAPSLQDEADEAGGCWKPIVNIRVGLGFIQRVKAMGGGLDWWETARRYNAGPNSQPPAGVAYADHNEQLRIKWRDLLND